MRALGTAAAAMICLGSVAVAAPAVVGAAPTAPDAVLQTAPLTWTPCPLVLEGPPGEPPSPPVPVECATLAVPLDHAEPAGRRLTLALFRLPARSPADRLGSLVMNPGGPGAPTKEFLAATSFGVPPELAARYDLVTFDPRGVGASEGLTCGGSDLEEVGEGADLFRAQVAYGAAVGAQCLAEDAALVARMTSTDIARDLDLIRSALGEERLTYVGFSWGTFLGAIYAELHPERVGRLVLDGVMDPNIPVFEELRRDVVAAEAALGAFFARCDADPDCALQPYGSEAVWRFLAWRAAEDDLVAPDGRVLDLGRFIAATYAALSAGPPVFPVYARFLLEAAQGDPTSLIEVADAYVGAVPAGSFYAIICGDNPERPTRDEVQLAAYDLIDDAPNLHLGIVDVLSCGGFPRSPTVRPVVAVPPGKIAPVLIIGNTLDPATPYQNARALAGVLGGSRLLTFEGEGHTIAFDGVPCVDEAVADYLLTGALPPPGATCQPPTPGLAPA